MNPNALKPKNNQTHSMSHSSLLPQSTGIGGSNTSAISSSTATAASSTKSPSNNNAIDQSNKCNLFQCSYANLMPNTSSSVKDQLQQIQLPQQPSTSSMSISTSATTSAAVAATAAAVTPNPGTILTIFSRQKALLENFFSHLVV